MHVKFQGDNAIQIAGDISSTRQVLSDERLLGRVLDCALDEQVAQQADQNYLSKPDIGGQLSELDTATTVRSSSDIIRDLPSRVPSIDIAGNYPKIATEFLVDGVLAHKVANFPLCA
ncbi:hypothetical protein PAAG_03082 [Paracoccidioides lutzii Pb01]|uniref:Uncharacterized protein n=1 Tax=Paracoccidioides lutzii (strain ATCC MYA-826 / Pb01) TaxID=502779 RepID=C1GYC8_PARBA|nr:hypothetical protein PAAG_03082 [Paracoccidioides lutzii Pb01]EEH41519.2 hypothetical protein PAAG_03082 [Paracoccidioides lutzii Pb01]